MTELLSHIPLLDTIIKFMMTSTALLGGVWCLEKLGLLAKPDLAELAWKLAIVGCFIAVVPFAPLKTATIIIDHTEATRFVRTLSEPLYPAGHRPSALATTIEQQGAARRTPAAQSAPQETPSTQISASSTPLKTNIVPDKNMPDHDSEHITGPLSEPLIKPVAETLPKSLAEPWYSAFRALDLAVIVWMMLALVALSALLFSYRRAISVLGTREPVPTDNRASLALQAICKDAGINRMPRLSNSSQINSPVCLPGREICLPDWAFGTMPEAELKSLLAHEVGHMLRGDPAMLIVLQFLSRIFFFQPLFILARARLTDIAELAADEWAARHLDDSHAVASALFTCATKINETRQIEWGMAMAGNTSILKRRVERLIKAQKLPFEKAATHTKLLVGTSIVALTFGMPAVQFADALSTDYATDKDMPTVVVAPTQRVQPAMPVTPFITTPEAPIPATQNKLAAASMPPKSTTPTALASVTTTPLVPAVVSISDDTPQVIQTPTNKRNSMTQINLHHDDGVLSAKWRGDFGVSEKEDGIIAHSKDGFFQLDVADDGEDGSFRLDVKNGISTTEFRLNGEITTDERHTKKWMKKAVTQLVQTGFDAEGRVAYLLKNGNAKDVLKATKALETDYVKSMYLTNLLNSTRLSERDLEKVARLTVEFDDQFAAKTVLEHILAVDTNAAALPAVLKAAEALDSDFELRSLLSAALQNNNLTNKNIAQMVDLASTRIDSDFELRQFYSALLLVHGSKPEVFNAVARATPGIESDFEKRQLIDLMSTQTPLDEDQWLTLIALADDLDSDFEKSNALAHLKQLAPTSAAITSALTEAGHEDTPFYGMAPHAPEIPDWDSENFERQMEHMERQLEHSLHTIERQIEDVKRQTENIETDAIIEGLEGAREAIESKLEGMEEKLKVASKTHIRSALEKARAAIDRELAKMDAEIAAEADADPVI